MNDIIPFSFEQRRVRISDRDGQPWFVAQDICDVLEISNHRDAVGRLDDDERASVIVDTLGGPQNVGAINESGLYKLVLRSRKQAAKRFTKWITAEVLPSIRRTGQYGRPAAPLDLSDTATLHRLLLEHTGKTLALENRNSELEPKAKALDRLTEADGALSITDTAKAVNTGPRALFDWLNRRKWIYRRAGGSHWVGYQDKIAAGLLTHKVARIPRHNQPDKFVEQVMVTPKGVAKIAELMASDAH